MTAPQILSVAEVVGAASQVIAVTAWVSVAVALAAVLCRWREVRADMLAAGTAALQVSRRAHTAGRHHRAIGRHRATTAGGAR